MTRVWTFSSVKWATSLAISSDNFGRWLQKSERSWRDITKLTFSFTTENKHKIWIFVKLHEYWFPAKYLIKCFYSNGKFPLHVMIIVIHDLHTQELNLHASTKACSPVTRSAPCDFIMFSKIPLYLCNNISNSYHFLMSDYYNSFGIQWSLTYPDYSSIRTHVWEPIMFIYMYIESVSLIRKFSYLDSHLGNGGVWISEGTLYSQHF